ncbi:hypothetical protein ACLBR5_12245 [Escherichia coli]
MSEGWNIAVLGATGAVGEALLETLAETSVPVGEIYALARNESAGEQLRFGGKTITVQDAAEFDWTQAQLAFFVAGKEATAAWVEEATNSGCLVIDSSGLFALEPDVPLVVPEDKPVCTDRLPQPECHRRTRQSDQPAAGGTETVNRSGRFVAYQCYQPDFSLRPGQKSGRCVSGAECEIAQRHSD